MNRCVLCGRKMGGVIMTKKTKNIIIIVLCYIISLFLFEDFVK